MTYLEDSPSPAGGDVTMTSVRRPASAPRNYPKGERRRAHIIQTAFQAFGTMGYRSASMVQIAADCGVSRAGLLHHFPTKESLLEAVLQERDRQDNAKFFAPAHATNDGLAYFTAMLRLVEHNQATPGIVSLFATLSTEAGDPDHPAHDYFVRRYATIRASMAAAIDDLDARGLLRDGVAPDGLEIELIALIDGLQIQWLHAPDVIDMPARLRARLATVIVTPIR